jgi:hypothetical protein
MPKPKSNYNWTGPGANETPSAPYSAIFVAMNPDYAKMTMSHLNYDEADCLYVEVEHVMIRNFMGIEPDDEGEPTIYVCIDPERLLKSNQRKLYRSLMDTLSYLKRKDFTIINTEEAGING